MSFNVFLWASSDYTFGNLQLFLLILIQQCNRIKNQDFLFFPILGPQGACKDQHITSNHNINWTFEEYLFFYFFDLNFGLFTEILTMCYYNYYFLCFFCFPFTIYLFILVFSFFYMLIFACPLWAQNWKK
jgi:hypothetical protein